MEIRQAEVVLWPEGEQWFWELTLNGEYVGQGFPTSDTQAKAVAACLGASIEMASGPIGFRAATDEEIQERDQMRRQNDRIHWERVARLHGLGLVRPSRDNASRFDELMQQLDEEADDPF